ncbi:MAG: hypothetical protein ACJ8GV_02335 [Luteimonas sp.]
MQLALSMNRAMFQRRQIKPIPPRGLIESMQEKAMQILVKVLALLALAVSSAAGQADPTDAFAVSAKLTSAGQTFAEPSAVVLAGSPASIEVAGSDGYTLVVTVSEIAGDQIRIAADLDSSHGSMAPTIVVRPGEPASVWVGDLGLELTVRRSGG